MHLFHSSSKEDKLGAVFGENNIINLSMMVGIYSPIYVDTVAFKLLSFVN